MEILDSLCSIKDFFESKDSLFGKIEQKIVFLFLIFSKSVSY